MAILETILLIAALLLLPSAFWFLRRMRTQQRRAMEEQHNSIHREALELMEPKDREELLRRESSADSTLKPD